MKSARFLRRFQHFAHNNSKQYFVKCQYRYMLQYSTNYGTPPINDDHHNANESPIMASNVQYPSPPIEERKQTPTIIITQNTPNAPKIEEYKDLQFEPSNKNSPSGFIPKSIPNKNVVDAKEAAQTPEEELALGGYKMDPLELRKMIPHGTASKQEVEEAWAAENAEWQGVHWSERQYTAKLGDIVNRQRPDEVNRMMESSKPCIHKEGQRSIQPVSAGGMAYPIFYDPKDGAPDRPQAKIPKEWDGRKARVLHVSSLQKQTGLNHSACAMEYDYASGQYSIALERLRNKQVSQLVELTHKSKEECKKVFDQCLGDYDKAMRKLNR